MRIVAACAAWRQPRRVLCAVAGALAMLGGATSAGAQGGGGRGQAAADTGATGNIVGVVVDSAGAPVPGVRVEAGPKFVSTTDSNGAFALRGLPVGSVAITLRRLGYAPAMSIWDVGATTLSLQLRIRAYPAVLPAVVAEGRREPFDGRLAGFNARRKKGVGYLFSRAQIDSMNESRLTDVLARVPGVREFTMPGALGTSVTMAGAPCPPLVMVDGFPASMGRFDLNMIPPSGVEGLEVYPHGVAVPPDLAGPYGTERCGLIAIWSRPMRPAVRADQLPPEHPPDLDSLLEANVVYAASSVDRPVRYFDGTAQPIYPDSLFRAGVGGSATARFVVDSLGRVEVATIHIVSATDKQFGDAVRRALEKARFAPARLDGRAVRQVVEMPFDFKPPAPDSAKGRESVKILSPGPSIDTTPFDHSVKTTIGS